ncbi:hypothetical protein [Streptomyces sp. LaBMicrA B280]|uniref:hypothetical protein n=1 Tax=Streptomyces sp. LaBMicrA B280 TaxID=3391001 RepID=UPI003BA69EC3
MNWSRKLAGTALAALSALPLSLAGGVQPASADTRGSCPYPYVCVYSNNSASGSPSAMYRDITSNYQTVTPRDPFSIINTRNDDTVYVLYVYGGQITSDCLAPNGGFYSTSNTTIAGIRIDDRSYC